MRISAVEEYGLRCLMALARKGEKEQLSISEIAEAEGLSIPYVSKLLAILRKAKLVSAVRGRGGGFMIARSPKEISLYEVLVSLGGPLIDPHHCQKYSGQMDQCVHIDNCTTHDTLAGLAGHIQAFLTATTLEDLAINKHHVFIQQIANSVTISRTALDTELKQVGSRVVNE